MNLELKNIDFSFPKKDVLKNVSIFFKENQIHGILGENGAGKSTMANIIYGELQPSSGQILLDGKAVSLKSPKDAIQNGICYVHQRPLLCENVTVYENLILGLNKKQIKNIPLLKNLFLSEVNLKTPLYNITSDIRFFISLTGALLRNPKILLLDEPSALLCQEQINFLYLRLREISNKGVNLIVITHSLKEAQNYCDDTFHLKKESKTLLIQSKKNTGKNDSSSQQKQTSLLCRWDNISCKTRNHIPLKNLNFSVKNGEITLIQGLAEDGLSLLEDIITGMNRFKCQGKFSITKKDTDSCCQKQWNLSKGFNAEKLRFKSGIKTGIIPTNKKFRGSFPCLTVAELLGFKHENIDFQKLLAKAKVNITEKDKAEYLSGGMLQRLLIARELLENPELLILCNPLQSLDTQGEEQFCKNLLDLQKEHKAVLILSSANFPAGLCTKEYKLFKGELALC